MERLSKYFAKLTYGHWLRCHGVNRTGHGWRRERPSNHADVVFSMDPGHPLTTWQDGAAYEQSEWQ